MVPAQKKEKIFLKNKRRQRRFRVESLKRQCRMYNVECIINDNDERQTRSTSLRVTTTTGLPRTINRPRNDKLRKLDNNFFI